MKKLLPVMFLLVLLFGVSFFESEFHLFSRMENLAMIGSSASVLPNPYNTLALQLKNKEQELVERESRLLAASPAVNDNNSDEDRTGRAIKYSIYLFAALFIMILFNFYLDFRERR